MRALAVVAGGFLYALALPPFGWTGCAWLTLAPVLWVVRAESTASAFRYGVLYGYAAGWAVTWCFAEAAAAYFGWPVPVAVAALSTWYLIVCGLPFGLFAAGSAVLLRSARRGEALVLVPALWTATEWLRGHAMGQPWGLLGYTQHAQLALLQVATLGGVHAVSYLVALGNAAVADLVSSGWRRVHAAPALAVAACWLAGSAVLPGAEATLATPARVAVVQTNVAPAQQWTRAYTDMQVAAHVRATAQLAPGAADLVVWPENSVPRYLEREPMLAAALGRVAQRARADLLIGGPRQESGRTYNAARLLTADGRNGGHYDKRRLVLFAEEKPLAFSGSGGSAESPEEFTAGTGDGILRSIVPLGVSICHEIVHPDLARASVRAGAELLVNVANDGWLDGGYEFAGRQHLAMAVFRAVETRRFLVRAATTGTSAVIDPWGRILAAQAPGTAGVLTASVDARRGLTPYVRMGDVFALFCVALVAWRLAGSRLRLVRRPRLVEAPAAS